MLVSSANSIGLANLLVFNERSFMYTCVRNSTEPYIETCGTPCFTCSYLEDIFTKLTIFH